MMASRAQISAHSRNGPTGTGLHRRHRGAVEQVMDAIGQREMQRHDVADGQQLGKRSPFRAYAPNYMRIPEAGIKRFVVLGGAEPDVEPIRLQLKLSQHSFAAMKCPRTLTLTGGASRAI